MRSAQTIGDGRPGPTATAREAGRKTWWPDPLRLLLLVLTALTIGRFHQYFSFLMPLRPALLCAALASGIAILNPQVLTRERPLQTWPSRTVIALAILACLSAVFGISLGASATFILDRFSKVLIFWLLLVLAIRHVGDMRLFVWGYLMGAGFLCYLSIFVYGVVAQYGSATLRLHNDGMFMYDPNDIGVLLVTAIPLALLHFQTSTGWRKWSCLVLIGAAAWTMALSGSRGGFLGMITVALALLFMLKQISVVKRVGTVALLAVTLTLAAPPGYWAQMQTLMSAEEDYNFTSENGHIQIWKRGIGYMKDFPFGVGIGNFGRAEGTISAKARNHEWGTGLMFTAPHNSFIEAGAELGVIGFGLWTSLVVGGFVGMLRLKRRIPHEWARATGDRNYIYHATTYMAVAFIGFGTTASFVSFAYLDPVYILAAFTAALYTFVSRLRRPRTAAPHRPWKQALVPGVGASMGRGGRMA